MKKKILIVDDEKDIVLILKDVFARRGYDVLTAFNGKEAMGCLKKEQGLNLILLDILMPELNGIEVLKQLKQKYPEVKTVILTGFLDEYRKDIEEIGCGALLNKPFSLKTLIKIIESILSDTGNERKAIEKLIDDPSVLPKAKLLCVETNELLYSSKSAYFNNEEKSKGKYEITWAFSDDDVKKRLKEFNPDIVLSNITMYRVFKLGLLFKKAEYSPKDIILYGVLSDNKDLDSWEKGAFLDGIFDPIAFLVNPKEMDRLGKIVRETAIVNGLYIRA